MMLSDGAREYSIFEARLLGILPFSISASKHGGHVQLLNENHLFGTYHYSSRIFGQKSFQELVFKVFKNRI